MKKMISLILSLCMLCTGAALAEAVTTTEPITLELEGFTLTLGAGEMYQQTEKVLNQPYLAVYPFASEGDAATNYIIHWSGTASDAKAEEMKALFSGMEDGLRAQLESQGFTLNAFNAQDPVDITLDDEPCVAFTYSMNVSFSDIEVTTFTRQIYIGSLATWITITAASEENLEKAAQHVAESLDIL